MSDPLLNDGGQPNKVNYSINGVDQDSRQQSHSIASLGASYIYDDSYNDDHIQSNQGSAISNTKFRDLPQIEIFQDNCLAYSFNRDETALYIISERLIEAYDFPSMRMIHSQSYQDFKNALYISVSNDETFLAYGNQTSVVIVNQDLFFNHGDIQMKFKATGDEIIQSSVFFTEANELFFFNDKQTLVKVKFSGHMEDAIFEKTKYQLKNGVQDVTKIQYFQNMFMISYSKVSEDLETISIFDPKKMDFISNFNIPMQNYMSNDEILITYLNQTLTIYEYQQNLAITKKFEMNFSFGDNQTFIELLRFEANEFFALDYGSQSIIILNIENKKVRKISLKSSRIPKIFKQHDLYKTTMNISPQAFLLTKNADKLLKINFISRPSNFMPALFEFAHKGKIQSISNNYSFFQRQHVINCFNMSIKKNKFIQLDGFSGLYQNGCYYIKDQKIFLFIFKNANNNYNIAFVRENKTDYPKYIKSKELQNANQFIVSKICGERIVIYAINQQDTLLKIVIDNNKKYTVSSVYDFGTPISEFYLSDKENLLFIRKRQQQDFDVLDLESFSLRISTISGTMLYINEEEKTVLVETDSSIKVLDYYSGQTLSELHVLPGGYQLIVAKNWIVIYFIQDKEFHVFKYGRLLELKFKLPIDFMMEKGWYFNLMQDNQNSNNIYFQNSVIYRLYKFYLHRECDQFYNGITEYLNFIPNCSLIEYHDNLDRYDFYDLENTKFTSLNVFFDYSKIQFIKNLMSKDANSIAKEISKIDLQDLLIHLPPKHGSFLHIFAHKEKTLQEFCKKLISTDQEKIPLLLYKNAEGRTPLDLVIEDSLQLKSVKALLDVIVKLQNNCLMNYVVDKHLCFLIEKGLDIDEYLNSSLCLHQIKDHTSFPTNHWDDSDIVKGSSSNSPSDILNNYDSIIGKHLKSEDPQDQATASIEYFLVNLPETLSQDPQRFMNALTNSKRLELFNNQIIQTIIKYKWSQYTRKFFYAQFFLYIFYFICFLTDFSLKSGEIQRNKDDPNYVYDPNGISIGLKAICLTIQAYFFYYEAKSAIRQGIRSYLSEFWNWADILLICLQVPCVILDLLHVANEVIQILTIFLLLMAYIKFNFFLMLFHNFRFLIAMLQGVFADLKYFLTFFALVVMEFGLLFFIMLSGMGTEDSNTGGDNYVDLGIFKYFIISFRTSAGDYGYLDSFENLNGSKAYLYIIAWVVWLLAVIILNIIFMNFIIAVIGESYEKVMMSLVAESFKVRSDLIQQREVHLNKKDFLNLQYFPKYLIIRRPVQNRQGANNEQEQFTNLILDLKQTVQENTQRLESRIRDLKGDIDEFKTTVSERLSKSGY